MPQSIVAGRRTSLQAARLSQAAEHHCRSQNIAVGRTFVAGCGTSLHVAEHHAGRTFVAGCGTSLQVAEHRAGRTFVAGCISSSSLPVGRNESTGREAWQGQHATKPHASLPWQLSTANPERVALALCRAWPRLAWPNQGISSCRRRAVRDGIMTTVILYLRSPSTLRCRGYTISEVCSAQGIETADKRHQWGPPLLQSALYEDNKGSKRAALRHASVRARARHRNIP